MLDLEQLRHERLRPIQRAEYDHMVDQGLFEGEKLELLRGMLVEMSPQGTGHSEAIRKLNRLLLLALHDRADISPQCPFAASSDSEPEPDLAVIPVGPHLEDHPGQAFLVIEVAFSSLRKDRNIKTSIYAENGVPEYWIVNLPNEVIEVHTDPSDGAYAQVVAHPRGATIALTAFPEVGIAVDDVLP